MDRPVPGSHVFVVFNVDTDREESTLATVTAADHETNDETGVYHVTGVTLDGNSTVFSAPVYQNEDDAREGYDSRRHAPTVAYVDETIPENVKPKAKRTRRTAAQKAADDAAQKNGDATGAREGRDDA